MVRLGPLSVDDWLDTYFEGLDAQLREFWMQSLYDQVSWIPRARRDGCRWRMNLRTLNLVRSFTAPAGDYLSGRYLSFRNVAALVTDPQILLGFPIDIEDDAIGAVLVERS